MMKPIVSCLGDIHLSPHIWARFPHIIGDSFVGFNSFIDKAIDIGAPILVLGDLFDLAKPLPELVSVCRQGFDRCRNREVPVYVVQGNHDKQETPWVNAIHDHPIYVGDGKPFKLGSRLAVASDYRLHDDIKQFIEEIPPEPEIAFLHQAARQALPFDGAWNCDLDWLPATIKVAILGDIHQPLDMKLTDGRPAYYTGAAHPRDIGQLAPKSFLTLYDDLHIERVAIPSRDIKKFSLVTKESVSGLRAWLSQASACTYGAHTLLPFAWVVYSPELASDVRELLAEFSHTGRAIMFCDPAPSAEAVLEISAETGSTDELDMTSALARYVDRASDPLLFNLVSEVLQSKRILDTVLAYRDKVIPHG